MEAVISPLMEKIIEKFQRTVLVLYRAVNDVVSKPKSADDCRGFRRLQKAAADPEI